MKLALLLTAAVAAFAQQPGADAMKLFASSADVQALIAKSKADRKEGQAIVQQRILALAPFNATLEYRASVGPAAIHDKEAEMFYVIEGAATMVTGGKLVNPTKNGDNQTATAIDGGDKRQIAKGDFIMVPPGVAHWFSQIPSTVVLMSLHLPK